MPIDVTCPGCLVRFKVSDQHAGKKGLCPKCKHEILVPSLKDKVVVHEAETSMGPKDEKGRPVLKPVAWSEMKVAPEAWAIAGAATIGAFAVAFVLRAPMPAEPGIPDPALGHSEMFLGLAAAVLGPPVAWLGYMFFRDEEFGGFEGTNLITRTVACGLAHAAVWGLQAILISSIMIGEQPSLPIMTFLVPMLLAAGTFASFVSLDLDWGAAFLHFSLFLTLTILLRLTLGLSPLGGIPMPV